MPEVKVATRENIGHFRSSVSFAHYLGRYRAAMAAMPVPDRVIDAPTSFGTVRVYRFPAAQPGPVGPPIVLLPGRNASAAMYRGNLPSLLRRRQAYCLDLLGEPGLSVQHKPIRDAEDQAQWLDETLSALDIAPPHLLGTSIGGWSAVNFAVRRPGRVASLTLLDAVMTFDRIPVPVLVASIGLVIPGMPQFVRRRTLSWISGGADLDVAVAEGELIAAGTADFALRLPAPVPITDAQLRALDTPVLAFIGGRSVMVRADRAAARARNLLRRGQIYVWPDASHAINGEYPEEIAAQAHRFWDGVES